MNTFVRDPVQEAAEEAGGVEGKRAHHNCKEGKLYLDGVAVESIPNVTFLMSEATHGSLLFDENKKLIDSAIKRFVDAKPDRNECSPPRKPATACLCVFEDTGQIGTYTGSSWSVRRAFMDQVFKPYNRTRKLGMFPVLTLGFKPGQKDEYGNHMPDFALTGWERRSKYALILGEGEASLPAIEAPKTPALPAAGDMPKYEEAPPPAEYDGPDAFDGVDFS